MSTDQLLKEQIISKAWEDAEFSAMLQSDPKAAMKEAFGIDIPVDLEVEVVNESSRKVYLVIPPAPAGKNPNNPEEVPDSQVNAPMW